jgi:hypothetical protein
MRMLKLALSVTAAALLPIMALAAHQFGGG